MLTSPWIAALVALFVWWFSTGAILFAVRRADQGGSHARLWACLMTLPIVVLGVAGFIDTLGDTSIAAVYVAFLAALAVWGWIELTFLTGTITGPVTSHSVPNVSEGERFIRAWGTVAYHEMLLGAVMGAMIVLSWGTENQFGMWTFAVLFAARISAKLNLYLGVRKVNVEFIPEPLNHLPSHFRTARMNWLFPMSITGLSFAAACWLERVWSADTTADTIGFALLGTLTMLALLEHWFMVLPLPDEKLWRWMLPERPQPAQATRLSEET
ncbi:putative photosynthetic complex assembly protein PuhE [Hasllibacter sp. MH4015]|uniref:putative photosynthetic complex assembly protein PuhE n=1 Tax=Hasllibacter sp. MH4015 TaxID=2854029 RepID=UPI001CD3C2A8|nr:putative photosynthetic complex assembly protein PuhE [Hasllibacter sp. MH4015]